MVPAGGENGKDGVESGWGWGSHWKIKVEILLDCWGWLWYLPVGRYGKERPHDLAGRRAFPLSFDFLRQVFVVPEVKQERGQPFKNLLGRKSRTVRQVRLKNFLDPDDEFRPLPAQC